MTQPTNTCSDLFARQYYQAVKITWISSADHHDLSLVCQAQAYQIVGQQKKWTSIACGGKGGVDAPITPPPYGPVMKQFIH